jgi:hypothetical protein
MGGFSDRGVTSSLLKQHPPSIPKELYKHMVLCIANHNGVAMDSTKQQPVGGKMNGNLLSAVKALP